MSQDSKGPGSGIVWKSICRDKKSENLSVR